MGWGRYFLLGNFGQQLDIEEHRNELTSLRRQLARARQSRSSGASAAELA
ncbi:MAG: hypothetical protein O3A20_08355 [Planctomycetota bacterium]|nr:hypothetical protein [Planctomycetota bacterium]